MLLDLAASAVLLIVGNVLFWRFDPRQPLWRRTGKVVVALAATAVVSHYFGHKGVLIEGAIILIPLIFVHGIWLPRHGVNGLTAEPRDKYYALRGWPLPEGEKPKARATAPDGRSS